MLQIFYEAIVGTFIESVVSVFIEVFTLEKAVQLVTCMFGLMFIAFGAASAGFGWL